MAKDPAFLFYPNDYIGGTMGMTFEEKGAYIELLMMQFNRGHMTSHMIGQTVGQIWDKIKDKFIQDENGLYYNKRLEVEQIKRRNFTESRRNNITGKNQYTTKKTGHTTKHMTNHMENENENVIINTFNKFWEKYPKKVNKKNAEKSWLKINTAEYDKIFQSLEKYIVCKQWQDKQFIPMSSTWLNQERWNDEIDTEQKNRYF